MSEPAEKLSVSVPADLARIVRERVGARGLSRFVARALRHEIEREQLGGYIEQLDAELGPVPAAVIRKARNAWPKR